MSNYSSQLRDEQQMVDRVYGRLDEMRKQTKDSLDKVRATGAHGSPTQRAERDSFATMYENRLTQLRSVEDRLVFGRLDEENGVRHYIGRIGLSDADYNPILIDWRAEAARPFYEATPAHRGDIVMRRHITLRFREVVGIEDEVLDVHSEQVSEASASGTLTGEGALLASLSSRRTGKMTDIVATIQAEQDRIIRTPLNRAVVVQGGPGTGKTAVALHRAAYLLYTHRNKLQRSGVLVVGPSSSFLHYIDQVLPSLGETGVVSRTIANLIPGVQAAGVESPRAAALKGDRRMATVIANAVSARIRVPENLPVVRVNGIKVPMRSTDIIAAQNDAKRTRQPHNKARETFVESMLHSMVTRYAELLDYDPDRSELASAHSMLRMDDQVRKTLNLAWLPMTAQWLLEDMWAKPNKLRRYAPWLCDDDLHELFRSKGSPLTPSDIPLLDEALELLGDDPREYDARARKDAQRLQDEQFAKDTLAQAGIGSGIVTSDMLLDQINGLDDSTAAQKAAGQREWTYGHIVVDEAQELTPMDWRMLMRRCPSRSFTIVGDVAQTSALAGSRSWQRTLDKLFGQDGWDLNELTIDYRNPQEVSDLASRFAEQEGLYISTVKAVRKIQDSVERIVVQDDDDMLNTAADYAADLATRFVSADGTGRIAVIADPEIITALDERVWSSVSQRLGEDRAQALRRQKVWDSQVSLCTPQDVKGLEFDAVVVVQPGLIEDNAPARQVAASDLYVAMTRPTQKLVIVRTKDDADHLPM
ncbi:HelD family protein [Bifidobacterium tissieri]|uniref:ATP-dependent DNA helicase n=1 Tax=Bifidobacterium tissieri TaxID=1630162 RepID=A0A5M9ZXN5_9BIFI|nr:AAA family ATPase [Bifidobacterium tissieri]KAA8832107.1 ATP-dependent DNA helicase [Bifidobacterium tissieri]KAA8832278.1 ATP-dependent DNA helicase [Bifidobacterium tissieri]